MKKLSILIALLLCVTVSGVYAVWTYAGSTDIADGYAESKITIVDYQTVGANGTYTVTSNLVLSIDQANEDHEAELVFSSTDGQPIYLKVVFTPAAHAPADIKANAVPSELYFNTTVDMEYEGVDILTFTNPGNGTLDNVFAWTKEADGTFTYTLDETALRGQISLSKTFVLDTISDHDAFRAVLVGNVVARVTDGTINAASGN